MKLICQMGARSDMVLRTESERRPDDGKKRAPEKARRVKGRSISLFQSQKIVKSNLEEGVSSLRVVSLRERSCYSKVKISIKGIGVSGDDEDGTAFVTNSFFSAHLLLHLLLHDV